MPYFTIVIPTYNHGQYVVRAVESVLAQGDDDWELVVVDDGSTDDTSRRLAPFAARARLIRTANRGAPAARNTGIDAARGLYVVLLDADDRLLPGALAAFRETLARRPELDLVCGGHVSVTDDGRRKDRPAPRLSEQHERDFAACVSGAVEIQNGAVAVRREVYEQVRYAEAVRTSDDVVFYARLVAVRRCGSIERALVEKHAHPGRLRDDYRSVVRDCQLVTDLLFDPRVLPPQLMSYRRAFHARQLLTVFRAHYRQGHARAAIGCYGQALWIAPFSALRWSVLRKLLRCLPRALFERHSADAHSTPPRGPHFQAAPVSVEATNALPDRQSIDF